MVLENAKTERQRRGIGMRRRNSSLRGIYLVAAVCFASAAFAAPAKGHNPKESESEAPAAGRAVSLSLVAGTVIVRSAGAPKWAPAGLNMPIEEGVSVATARNSFAEIEFENGSTVRLGPLSRVDFTALGFANDDGYLNHLTLVFGVATIDLSSRRKDQNLVSASGADVTPCGNSEFRTDVHHGRLRVEVFKGRVEVASGSQSEELKKNQALARDGAGGVLQATQMPSMDDWDKWVQARDKLAELAAYRRPGPGNYDWESTLPPFGDMTFPGADDGF